MQIHIGHHFFGSGNIGDDWMLSGFFAALRGARSADRYTCCTPFDRASQSHRFPAIEWLPYDPVSRQRAIDAADAWLGLGDTPFQSDTGRWFIEHLVHERQLCEARGVPMWFLGVGVNNREVFDIADVRSLARSAAFIWTRDSGSAEWIAAAAGPARVKVGADLSHAWFNSRADLDMEAQSPAEPDTTALCLNFEDRAAFEVDAIAGMIAASSERRLSWLVQEIRALEWSERTLLAMLDRRSAEALSVIEPDYRADTTARLVERWGRPEIALSSRYHATVALAWRGARVAAVTRNDKVRSLAQDLEIPSIASLTDARTGIDALHSARRVPIDRLRQRAAAADRMVQEWADAAAAA
jgi:polysaccharide pyruvyl transferase WcaK-like protein